MDHFSRELKLIDGPVRWLFWLAGLLSVWHYRQGAIPASAIVGLLIYLALNIILIPILPRAKLGLRRYLTMGLFAVDLLFTTLLIHHTGGLISQLFLLYCLLIFKAAIYYPYIHAIILAPFAIFPLYIVILYLGTGTLVFVQDQLFASRYALLLIVTFAGMYTAWHLDNRHRHTRDLLEQLEAEHRQLDERQHELRAVLDSIADGVLVVDPELRLRMINPVAADLLNLSYPQPSGIPLRALINQPAVLTLLRQALNKGQVGGTLLSDEIRARPKSTGKRIICQVLATALIGGEGIARGAVVVLRDMTRQIELEESKSNFISMLSHELRTPLTAIRGFVELIMTGDIGEITPQQNNYLNIVMDQSDHLGNLISALLEFAELEASAALLQLEWMSLERLVSEVVGQFESLADHRAIDLEVRLPPKLAPVYADSVRLERVLFNLVDNAIKFTPEQGRITVSISERDSETLVCVTDTGRGVPPAERERIFESFYQVDSSSTREHRGAGLGLALCKHIIELHRGSIWVEQPSSGLGSRFCFTIPRDLAKQIESDKTTLWGKHQPDGELSELRSPLS